MAASVQGQIWYRATVARQKYSVIIEEMGRLGHEVTVDEIRRIVAEEKGDRKRRMASGLFGGA